MRGGSGYPTLQFAQVRAPRLPLLAILAIAVLLRVALIFSGGQSYWPDEGAYEHARKIVASLVAGDMADVRARFDGAAPHVLYRIVALVPASVEYVTAPDARFVALFFAICSVVNVWLIGRIAADLGASPRESLLAAALAAMSNSLFYYARHLLSYDCAMMLALIALHLNLSPAVRMSRAFAAGVLAGCTFLTYAGYWTLGGAALLLPLIRVPTWPAHVVRAVTSGCGLVGFLGAAMGISAALGGHLLKDLMSFSGTISQGRFEEGWRLPLAYLWDAEHGVVLLWMGALIWGVFGLMRGNTAGPTGAAPSAVRLLEPGARPRVIIGLAGIAFLYGSMAMLSVGLHRFVVYGRLVRQLVPFLCLLAAAMLGAMVESPRAFVRYAAIGVLVATLIQAGFNIAQPLRLRFPAEFVDELTNDEDSPGRRADAIWINARHFYPRPEPVKLPDRYVLIADAPHPLQFKPYQYEGYLPEDRAALRAEPPRMRLILPAP